MNGNAFGWAYFGQGFSTSSGPTTYNQSVSGALSFSGAAPTFLMQRRVTGVFTPAGSLLRATPRTLVGASFTPAGSLASIKALLRTVTASFTPTGALSPARRFARTLVGASFTPHGVATGVKVLARTLTAAALSFIGGTNLYPDPALYPDPNLWPYGGAILFQLNRILTGVVQPAATLGTAAHASSRLFTAVLQPVGTFAHRPSRLFSAVLHPVASFSAQKAATSFAKSLFASLTAAGSLSSIVNPGHLDQGGGGFGVPMPDAFFQRYEPTLRRQKTRV